MKKDRKDIHFRVEEETYKKIVAASKRSNSKNLTEFMLKSVLNKTTKKENQSRNDIYFELYNNTFIPLYTEIKNELLKYKNKNSPSKEITQLTEKFMDICNHTSHIFISMMDTENRKLYKSYETFINSVNKK